MTTDPSRPLFPFEAVVEAAAAAWWNVTGNPRWDAIPAEWKPAYRARAREALLAALQEMRS